MNELRKAQRLRGKNVVVIGGGRDLGKIIVAATHAEGGGCLQLRGGNSRSGNSPLNSQRCECSHSMLLTKVLPQIAQRGYASGQINGLSVLIRIGSGILLKALVG
jgi:hypothetical protein